MWRSEIREFKLSSISQQTRRTSLSLKKLPIYLALGVPEIWRYYENNLSIYQLTHNDYFLREVSPTFSNLPVPIVISQPINRRFQVGERYLVNFVNG
jgi:hypothetical protein